MQRWDALATLNRFLPPTKSASPARQRRAQLIVHPEGRHRDPLRPLFIIPVRLSRCYLETQLIAPPCAAYPLIAFFRCQHTRNSRCLTVPVHLIPSPWLLKTKRIGRTTSREAIIPSTSATLSPKADMWWSGSSVGAISPPFG